MQHSQVEESDVEPGEEDASENGEDFPADREAAVEFGWEDKRPLTGRRLKAAKDKQKKAKSGSFGERRLFHDTFSADLVFNTISMLIEQCKHGAQTQLDNNLSWGENLQQFLHFRRICGHK